MKVTVPTLCVLLSLFAVPAMESHSGTADSVRGMVVDVMDARVVNAIVTFWRGDSEFVTKTRSDGTYSINLEPGTYTMSVRQVGFCTVRRAAFVLNKRSSLRFNFQVWICPTDTEFLQYAELDEVPHTHLKPLMMFATDERRGDLRSFHGPITHDDGTGHGRKYPAVMTFNWLAIRAQEIVYDPSRQLVSAAGDVMWEDGTKSGTGNRVELKLDKFEPKPQAPD